MKQLEIKTNKRLLIVEIEMAEFVASMLIGDFFPNYQLEFICRGCDLTEEVAYNLVERTIEIKTGKTKFYNYKDVIQLPYYNKALEALISAIESKRWFWGDTIKCINTGAFRAWKEAESSTFNPSKCIIFEIL